MARRLRNCLGAPRLSVEDSVRLQPKSHLHLGTCYKDRLHVFLSVCFLSPPTITQHGQTHHQQSLANRLPVSPRFGPIQPRGPAGQAIPGHLAPQRPSRPGCPHQRRRKRSRTRSRRVRRPGSAECQCRRECIRFAECWASQASVGASAE
jgi:hypothetical protein